MTYRSLVVREYGGPEVLEVVERELRPPAKGEARIRVLASSVSRPDVSARRGEALYSGTVLSQKTPFTPGYSVIGEVDATRSRTWKTGRRCSACWSTAGSIRSSPRASRFSRLLVPTRCSRAAG